VCVCVCVCVCALPRGRGQCGVVCVTEEQKVQCSVVCAQRTVEEKVEWSSVWCVHRGGENAVWRGVCTEEEKMQCGVVCFTVEEKVHCSVVWCGVCTDRKQVECRVRKIPESSPTLKVMATLFGDSVLKEFALKPVLTTFCSRPLYAVLEAWPS